MQVVPLINETNVYIDHQNDLQQNQNQNKNNEENLNGNEMRKQHFQQNNNYKKKSLKGQQQQQQQANLVQNGDNKKKNNQSNKEFIPQKPTDQIKKERRNKDRFSHLQKLLPKKSVWVGYLDVGCGNAEISTMIAQNLGIQNVYGIDMFHEDDFVQPNADLQIKYIQNCDNNIRIPDNSVDIVTCFMAIHHFDHLDLMLREIQRVLLIDGYLFIREHDVPQKNEKLRVFIEEMHRKYPDHPADGYMRLFDRDDLRNVLKAYGFQHLGDSNYTGSNPQAVYHSLYILKTKDIDPISKQLIQNDKTSDTLQVEYNNLNNQTFNNINEEKNIELNKSYKSNKLSNNFEEQIQTSLQKSNTIENISQHKDISCPQKPKPQYKQNNIEIFVNQNCIDFPQKENMIKTKQKKKSSKKQLKQDGLKQNLQKKSKKINVKQSNQMEIEKDQRRSDLRQMEMSEEESDSMTSNINTSQLSEKLTKKIIKIKKKYQKYLPARILHNTSKFIKFAFQMKKFIKILQKHCQ